MTNQFDNLVSKHFPSFSVVSAKKLEGGVSAEVTLLELRSDDGEIKKVVVRKYGAKDLVANANVAEKESSILKVARRNGVAVPEVLALDASGQSMGSPVIVISFVEGKTKENDTNLPDFCKKLAKQLGQIHKVALEEVAFLPEWTLKFRSEVDTQMGEDKIQTLLKGVALSQSNRTLIHGDFWPGNILMRDGKIAAVLDWEDAAIGNPLFDVADCRLEMLWGFGDEVKDMFTQECRSFMEFSEKELAVWDLIVALKPCGNLRDWGLEKEVEDRMIRQHAEFVQNAAAILAK